MVNVNSITRLLCTEMLPEKPNFTIMRLFPQHTQKDYLMSKKAIATPSAPEAIGIYSQAIAAGNTVYLSGQIPLLPESMQLVSEDFTEQAHQVFRNLRAVCQAAGGDLDDIVKVNAYLTNLADFAKFNEVMAQYFTQPYPARAAVGVSALPRGAQVEAEAVMVLNA